MNNNNLFSTNAEEFKKYFEDFKGNYNYWMT